MSIIKNYGFLWERQYICRGKGSNAGHLIGTYRGHQADFREQIGVYALHDRNQKIIYVGQAGNGNATLFSRLKNHLDGRMRSRWDYFTWFGFKSTNQNGSLSAQQDIKSAVSGFKYSTALDQLEAILITVIEPNLNKQAGKLGNAVRYQQLIDESLAPRTNSEIYDELKALRKELDSRR